MSQFGVNLLDLIGGHTTLKRTSSSRGGTWNGACPKCGGKDRFVVEPAYELWMCRQCHPEWDDAIEFLRWVDGLSYRAAVERIQQNGGRVEERPARKEPARPAGAVNPLNRESAAFTPAWQAAAVWFAEECEERLWSPAGERARRWLTEVRRIHPAVIRRMRLGFHEGDERDQWGDLRVFLPRSIVIPWWIGRQVWKLNLRPSPPIPDKKYLLVAGSGNGLYNADALNGWSPAIMVEGEMNALSILSATDEFVPVATGAVSWARAIQWVALMAQQGEVLLAFDRDAPGQQCAMWWQQHLPGSEIIQHPDGVKDANELMQRDPQRGILDWLGRFSVRTENLAVSEQLKAQIRAEMWAKGWNSELDNYKPLGL